MATLPMPSAASAAGARETEMERRRERRRERRMASTHYDPMMTTRFVIVVVIGMMMMMMSVVVCVVDSSSIASTTQDGVHLQSDIYRKDDDDKHIDCQNENGNCHSNQNCCHGYICLHEMEEVSGSEDGGGGGGGVCRRSNPNHLSSCHSNDQCAHGSQCIDSDETGQGICQRVGSVEERRHKDWSQHMYQERRGGLGSGCETTSDCKPFTMDGTERLCCQDVRRGRQGTKRMCDRVTGIAICIQ